ncbi:MAG TPA: hypothetical protein VH165_30675 [Kofleriaceae bacterium]|jgi:hypothetical protein|nr:hypothetical protein [Kofleriaceae bacterium]
MRNKHWTWAAACGLIALQFNLARADWNSNLGDKARTAVGTLAPKGDLEIPVTVLVSVKSEHLTSQLRDGLVNIRLSTNTDGVFNQFRTNRPATPTAANREAYDLRLAAMIGIPEPQKASSYLPDLFPKSSFLATRLDEACGSTGLVAPGQDQVRTYGDVWLELTGVADRMTFTPGDSLDDRLTMQSMHALAIRDFVGPRATTGRYVEGLIWGPVTSANIKSIWIKNDAGVSTAANVDAAARQYGVPVQKIVISSGSGKYQNLDCVTLSGTPGVYVATPPTATQVIDQLKAEYATALRSLASQAAQPDAVDDAWRSAQAQRLRSLYFLARTAMLWIDVAVRPDALTKIDETLFAVYQKALKDGPSTVVVETTAPTKDEIAARFYPHGTSWKAFFQELQFWCQETANKATVGLAVATLSASRRAMPGLTHGDMTDAYAACGGPSAYSFKQKLEDLAWTAVSQDPKTAPAELGAAVDQMTTAIGMPAFKADVVAELAADARQRVRSAKAALEAGSAALGPSILRAKNSQTQACASFGGKSVPDLQQLTGQLQSTYDSTNRACNLARAELEEPYSGAELIAYRKNQLNADLAKVAACQQRDQAKKDQGAIAGCLEAIAAVTRLDKERLDNAAKLAALRHDFSGVLSGL